MKAGRMKALALFVIVFLAFTACDEKEELEHGTEKTETLADIETQLENAEESTITSNTEYTNTEQNAFDNSEATESTEKVEQENAEIVATSEAVEGPAYTVTAFAAKTMYAIKSVNVRTGPSSEYSKIGSLSVNQEVSVTGVANESGWYQIDFAGGTAFVSNNYLSDSKVEVPKAESQTKTQNTGTVSEPAQEQAVTNVNQQNLVWVDDTAKKYHKKNGCGMDNAYQVTLEEALAMGKTACKRCYK